MSCQEKSGMVGHCSSSPPTQKVGGDTPSRPHRDWRSAFTLFYAIYDTYMYRIYRGLQFDLLRMARHL